MSFPYEGHEWSVIQSFFCRTCDADHHGDVVLAQPQEIRSKSFMSDTGDFWQKTEAWPLWTAVGGIGTAIAAIIGWARKQLHEDSGQTLNLVTELVGLLKTANETIIDLKAKVEELERKVDELSARLHQVTSADAVL
ncbi:hypothetical protein [Beijerinckia indica]|nr:hypothetical protein [Beijerinckia indica]